ncbi:hypothetical protein N7495_008549 [Penicillium taxi]|uniref:uncharacterized protein n=1 Tax=Penicillium taxi TaxID=168475 RepID=UPI002544D3ED|nr:uncharacterized protein N7495_008549 [Penicillium taxi]KAJ5888508.1 hypothetical protein N7495_008549 [Penicillium taxi]
MIMALKGIPLLCELSLRYNTSKWLTTHLHNSIDSSKANCEASYMQLVGRLVEGDARCNDCQNDNGALAQ